MSHTNKKLLKKTSNVKSTKDNNSFISDDMKNTRYKLHQFYQAKYNESRVNGQLEYAKPNKLSMFTKDCLIMHQLSDNINLDDKMNDDYNKKDYLFERDLFDDKYEERLKNFISKRKNKPAENTVYSNHTNINNPNHNQQMIHNSFNITNSPNHLCSHIYGTNNITNNTTNSFSMQSSNYGNNNSNNNNNNNNNNRMRNSFLNECEYNNYGNNNTGDYTNNTSQYRYYRE